MPIGVTTSLVRPVKRMVRLKVLWVQAAHGCWGQDLRLPPDRQAERRLVCGARRLASYGGPQVASSVRRGLEHRAGMSLEPLSYVALPLWLERDSRVTAKVDRGRMWVVLGGCDIAVRPHPALSFGFPHSFLPAAGRDRPD